MQGEDYQLAVEENVRYQNFCLAEKLNTLKLIGVHKHQKETIKLQIKRLSSYKQFMTMKQQSELSAKIMSSHFKKFEVIAVLRLLAVRYSDLGDQTKVQSYLNRAEKLTQDFISNPDNMETLQNKIVRVELLLK